MPDIGDATRLPADVMLFIDTKPQHFLFSAKERKTKINVIQPME